MNADSTYDQLWEVLSKKLDYISKYLGDKEFLQGNLTINDFIFNECLWSAFLYMKDKIFEHYPNLKAYTERFNNLKGVKEQLEKNKNLIWIPPHIPLMKKE